MPIGARGARALLNLSPHHSTAAIVAEIEDTREWKDGEVRGRPIGTKRDGDEQTDVSDLKWELEPEATLQISNCDRSIAFEINFTSEAERVNSLHKLDTLIETLTAFREGVADEQQLFVERLEKYEEEADRA